MRGAGTSVAALRHREADRPWTVTELTLIAWDRFASPETVLFDVYGSTTLPVLIATRFQVLIARACAIHIR